MKFGFIICSRLKSERLPGKVFRKINGVPLIEHLIKRLQKCNLPIILAVPTNDASEYFHLAKMNNVYLYSDNNESDPLKRMYNAAKELRIDVVIRVTHDKIFIDDNDVKTMIDKFGTLDYLYSTSFIPGTGFELISRSALQKASDKFTDIEFIGFAIKQITTNILNVKMDKNLDKRLLIDFPEDVQLIELILSSLGNQCSKADVISFLDANHEFMKINSHPIVSIYTCGFNAEKWIKQAMDSVRTQVDFKKMEYILIDDFSSDRTFEEMIRFSLEYSNVKVIRNEQNLGLASSSNKALKLARGKYIIRLDADDYFTMYAGVKTMVSEIQKQGCDVVYPHNYLGVVTNIQKGNENHHVGGALFHRDAVNHLKFSEGLRHHDSLDIFLKAKEFLKLGYYNKALFMYRQHDASLSKSDPEKRKRIESGIRASYNRSRRENRY